MVVKWTFFDSVLNDTYTFEVNPKDGGSFASKKKFNYEAVTDPRARTVMFEGRDEVKTTTFSGTILTEAQFTAMGTWFSKRYWITMTDDLGRSFSVYITGYDPKRKWTVNYPWRHEYSVECVLSQITI